MIKRISFIFLAVVMVVVTMAVPAFAAEVQDEPSIKIVKQPVDCVSNDVKLSFSIVVAGDVSSYQWQNLRKDGTWFSVFGIDNSGCTANYYTSVDSTYDGEKFRCVVTGSDGTVLISDVVVFYYKNVPFNVSVKQSISFVINWVGTVVNSLISPEGSLYPLLPILAIGIAVTAVLLVTKIFKSFSWGL